MTTGEARSTPPRHPTESIPLSQIVAETWAPTVGLILSTVGAVILRVLCQGLEATGAASQVNTILAAIGIVMKGSIAAILGIALYQLMWETVAKDGMTLRQMHACNMASRLQVGAISTPVLKVGWFIGLMGLIVTSAIVPALQAGVKFLGSQVTRPQSLTTYHTGLNGTLAETSGASQYPANAISQVIRGANQAFLGEGNSYSYLNVPLTGETTIGPVDYADITCTIRTIVGIVTNNPGQFFYNFTDFDFFRRFDFKAVMYNNTHYLLHDCSIKPVTGNCHVFLKNGTAAYNSLKCIASEDILIPDHLKNLPWTKAAGFDAIVFAFYSIFKGASWRSIQSRPQTNTTFTQLAITQNQIDIAFPADLFSHMTRVLWNIPFTTKNVTIENDQVPVQIQATNDIIIVHFDDKILIPVVAISWLLWFVAIIYLLSLRTGVGRLVVDTIVHSLTVAGRFGPGIPDSVLMGLSQVKKEYGERVCRLEELHTLDTNRTLPRVGIDEGMGNAIRR